LALEPVENLDAESLPMWRDVKSGAEYRRCFNDTEYHVCNWLVTSAQENVCLACNLNDTMPDVDSSYRANRRRRWWGRMEQAKRRLIYTLLALGLPVDGKAEHSSGLAFSFLEDQRSNPMADEEGYVYYPNVNIVEEMTNMISSSRSFQMNVDVMNAARTMMQRVMSLGQ